jgi:hypothetical protein
MPASSQPAPSANRQELSLNEMATHVLEECRTVVPGARNLADLLTVDHE